jgi:DNA-binding NtrC family response regulator
MPTRTRDDELAAEDLSPVETLSHAGAAAAPGTVRRFRVTVLQGPNAGRSRDSRGDRCALGHHRLNDVVLPDPTVSRFHCEIVIEDGRARVRDLGSRNGTLLDDVAVQDAFLRDGSRLRLGLVLVGFELADRNNQLRLADRAQFGPLVGRSAAMRSCFALLERAAETEVTLLLEGETGTGKSAAAEAIHRASARKKEPFVVVDCGAIPAPLLESELFGHEKGAFTGASERRRGAFEEAHGGTLLLDEIGELPAELQPKLLGAIETRQIRRVGASTPQRVNVRLLAATNRDLRVEVNAGRFRSDLYFRLAVVKIQVPSLRQRPEDIPELIEQLLAGRGDATAAALLRDPARLGQLQRAAWPGNVRELRNYVERCLFYRDAVAAEEPEAPPEIDVSQPFSVARKQAMEQFERVYLGRLLRAHDGRIQETADAAGINRVYLYKLLRRLGLK